MEHDKQWYVEQHRAMWNWIADCIEDTKTLYRITDLKEKWCKEHGFCIQFECFACEYDSQFDNNCKHCLFDWGKRLTWTGCTSGYLMDIWKAKTWKERAELARKIANLPVREEV